MYLDPPTQALHTQPSTDPPTTPWTLVTAVTACEDGWKWRPRLRPVNFTTGPQLWPDVKVKDSMRTAKPNCHGFPPSCTWICNPRGWLSLSYGIITLPSLYAPCLLALHSGLSAHPLMGILHSLDAADYRYLFCFVRGMIKLELVLEHILQVWNAVFDKKYMRKVRVSSMWRNWKWFIKDMQFCER